QVKLQFVAKPQLGRKNARPMRPLTAKTRGSSALGSAKQFNPLQTKAAAGVPGPDLKEAIDRQSTALVKKGRSHLDGYILRTGVPSSCMWQGEEFAQPRHCRSNSHPSGLRISVAGQCGGSRSCPTGCSRCEDRRP